MNEYLIECFGCDDEMIVSTGSDIPAFCPLCGEDDIVVTKKEFVMDTDWDEDDEYISLCGFTMDMNLPKLPRTIKDSSTASQNWIQIKNISVKRTFGGLRYYQKIQSELGECAQNNQATGKNIMDLVKNFKYALNSEGQIITKEKLSDSAEPKERCPTLKQKLSSIMTSFFPISGTTSL